MREDGEPECGTYTGTVIDDKGELRVAHSAAAVDRVVEVQAWFNFRQSCLPLGSFHIYGISVPSACLLYYYVDQKVPITWFPCLTKERTNFGRRRRQKARGISP